MDMRCFVLDTKLLELVMIHINDNGVDMIIKSMLRENIEICWMTCVLAAYLHIVMEGDLLDILHSYSIWKIDLNE